MNAPLNRLYRTKLLVLALVLLLVGPGFLTFGHWVDAQPTWRWLHNWLLIDIGSGLFTTVLFGVAWQYIDGVDGEVRDTERLQRVLADSAPAMRDAVICGSAFVPEDVARVSTPETLDQIVENALAIRLGDPDLAREIYDAQVSIRLSPLPGTRHSPELFSVVMHWEYELTPTYATGPFVCTSDETELRDLSSDNAGLSVWYLAPAVWADASGRTTSELMDFSVDGVSRPIRRSSKADSQTYSASLGSCVVDAKQPVRLVYTYRTVIAVAGNRLRLRLDQPTRDMAIELDYSDTSVTDMSVLDYIASSERVRVSRTPEGVPGRVIRVELDEWALPRSGVAFVWQ